MPVRQQGHNPTKSLRTALRANPAGEVLHCFPTPYPDELFYSLAARQRRSNGLISDRDQLLELFDNDHIVASVELPTRLAAFQSRLRDTAHPCKQADLIERHTLFSWYAPFMRAEQAAKVRNLMLHGTGEGVHTIVGIVAGGVPAPEFLRYCPTCLKEDRDNLPSDYRIGKVPLYWRRLHQMSGIEVCPIHKVFLEASESRRQRRQNRHGFEVPDMTITWSVSPRPIGPDEAAQLQVAQLGAELLAKDWRLPAGVTPVMAWRRLLAAKGMSLPSGRIQLQELVDRVSRKFSEDYLASIHCELNLFIRPLKAEKTWVGQLLHKDQTHAPIRHLLLLAALDASLEEFFTAKEPVVPEAPQSACGNAVCRDREALVTAHTHGYSATARGMVAEYRCDTCGREWRGRTDTETCTHKPL